jgi:hypothetical protein
MPSRQKIAGIVFAAASAPDLCPPADQLAGEPAPLAAEDLLVRAVG